MRPFMLAAAIAATIPTAHATCQAVSAPHTVALVELYTSQGCSSCPPADKWLSHLPQEVGPDRAIALGLHVGYWDYIGWKDPFARREFNARQSALANASGSRSVYTPGVFVQGKEAPSWSKTREFDAQVRAVNQQPAAARISLDQVQAQDGKVDFKASAQLTGAPSGKHPRLYLALVQNGLSTRVTAGENRGETLANDRVARDWAGPFALGTTTVSLRAPSTAATDLALVAFVEDDSGILQTMELPLNTCKAG